TERTRSQAMRCEPRRRKRSGATMVESAFVISIFLLFLFGIFEYGRYVMTRQIMENAAREGARWASVNTATGTTVQVQNLVDQKMSMAAQQLTPYNKTTNITVFAADSSGNLISGKNWQDAGFGENIAVQVTGTYTPILPSFLKMSSTYTVTTKAVM